MRRFWDELRRRHVVRVVVFYAIFAWVVVQVGDIVLEAFGLEHLLRFLVAGAAAALPLVVALSWMFDITPAGVARTAPLAEDSIEPFAAPAGSLAVLPFANLSEDSNNEYFSEGLAEEIRNQLAGVPGLKVVARSSSAAFKNRVADARDIGRRLNVATILEGGVRKQADAVRISLELVSTTDGFQVWSERYERRLEDIFQLQQEIAAEVAKIAAPLSGGAPVAVPGAVPHSFEAYNLYLRGRHHFHKRTESSLHHAVVLFEQAIALEPDYALAHSGLSDSWILLSSRYYGNLPAEETLEKALPEAQRALELAPALAEAHASLGLAWENQGDLESAGQSLRRALQLNPGYSMALVWYGLVLVKQRHFREAEQRNLEALKLDPLSPIINVNVGFDSLRRGDTQEAKLKFAAAVEIDPAFPVPHYGLARAHAQTTNFDEALKAIDEAIRRAPERAFYHAQRGLILLQTGAIEDAARSVEAACKLSPNNPFDADLIIAHHMARGDQETLTRIAGAESGRRFNPCQRAQAHIALGNYEEAHRLYETATLNREQELSDLITDDWIWRLPHVINLAHLRLLAGDRRGQNELQDLLNDIESFTQQGVSNPVAHYWSASASSLLGRNDQARSLLAAARAAGWNHAWWERLDWNLRLPADNLPADQVLSSSLRD